MKELIRQIVVFGNFNKFDFSSINKFSDFISEHNLTMNAAPDYNAVSANGQIEITIGFANQNPVSMRPVFYNADRTLSIFIGTTRIHIEQANQNVDTYNDFTALAYSFFEQIFKDDSNLINRIAVNGKFVQKQEEINNNIFAEIFNKSDLYGECSNEFSFRVNTNIYSDKLDSNLNQIISYSKTFEIENNEKLPIQIIDYDYNTVIDETKTYSIEQINILIEEAKVYREKILN